MNKTLKKPSISKKLIKYKNVLGLGALALATSIAANSLLTDDPITIGIVTDRTDDNFEKGVPLYSDPNKSKLVTVLPDGCLIISTDEIGNEPPKTYKVSAINEQDVKVHGYIPCQYVQNTITIDSDSTLYKVKEEKGVNLRSSPEIADDNKIGALPYGATVIGTKDSQNWSHVTYITKHSMQQGFAYNEFLQELSSISNEKAENSSNSIQVDYVVENGHVFFIDIYDIPPKLLEKLLTGEFKIPEVVKTGSRSNVDLSDFSNRKPDGVYIKLFATYNRSKSLIKGRPTPYKELSAVCERLKVPYGFYVYSTCLNEKEAKQEAKWTQEALEALGPRKYNLLPLVLDIEISDNKDRQFRVSRTELTNAKITLANILELDYGKTMIYSARNTLNTVFDIKQYHEGLNSGQSGLWLVSPLNSLVHAKTLKEMKPYVIARQIVLGASLDFPVPEGSRIPDIDINIFDAKEFKKCIEGEYQNRSLAYAAKKNNKAIATIANER